MRHRIVVKILGNLPLGQSFVAIDRNLLLLYVSSIFQVVQNLLTRVSGHRLKLRRVFDQVFPLRLGAAKKFLH